MYILHSILSSYTKFCVFLSVIAYFLRSPWNFFYEHWKNSFLTDKNYALTLTYSLNRAIIGLRLHLSTFTRIRNRKIRKAENSKFENSKIPMIFSSIQTELIFKFSNFQILLNQNSPYTVTILKVFWGTEEVNYNYIFFGRENIHFAKTFFF